MNTLKITNVKPLQQERISNLPRPSARAGAAAQGSWQISNKNDGYHMSL